MSDEQPEMKGCDYPKMTDAEKIAFLCQQADNYERCAEAAADERDAALARVAEMENSSAPMPVILRDVVRGQVLALLSAESREAVRCATNALGDALDKTAPPPKDDGETAEDRITALLDNPVTQTVIQKGLEYFCPAPPPAPTPNLTVTGPMGSSVVVRGRSSTGETQHLGSRIIGQKGVVVMAIPARVVEVLTSLGVDLPYQSRCFDFTEESHSIEVAIPAPAPAPAPVASPIATPPPAAKKRAPKRKA